VDELFVGEGGGENVVDHVVVHQDNYVSRKVQEIWLLLSRIKGLIPTLVRDKEGSMPVQGKFLQSR
jgi:hypothetical protein